MRHKHMTIFSTMTGYDIRVWCNGAPGEGWTYCRYYRNVTASTIHRFYARSMGYMTM